jgi:hypothetical protein
MGVKVAWLARGGGFLQMADMYKTVPVHGGGSPKNGSPIMQAPGVVKVPQIVGLAVQ